VRPSKPDEIIAIAYVRLPVGFEDQRTHEALELVQVVGIFRRDQQVEVDRPSAGCADFEPHLDVGKDKLNLLQATRLPVGEHPFVSFETVVVGDA
jgi:hypothetical protein